MPTRGRLGWALIGASTIAREYMVDAIRGAGDEPLWVVSQNADHAGKFSADCRIPRHTTDLAEALADPGVDAVYVSSANSRHHGQVVAAAAAGKHVLCDKPLATTRSDAAAMITACRGAGVVLAVNHHLRASAIHRRMRRMISDGAIGEVRSMSVLHAGLLREVLQTWRITDRNEGAIYLDLSVHDIDLARFLLQQEPVSAMGMGGAIALGSAGIHDHAMYVMQMSGGAFLQAHESFVTPGVESQVVVLGSTGMLVAQGTLAQRAGGTLMHRHLGGSVAIEVPPVDLYLETIRGVQAAIDGKGNPLASGEDGLLSLAGAETVREAVESGRIVPFRS